MTVGVHAAEWRTPSDGEGTPEGIGGALEVQTKQMRNHWITAVIGVLIWTVITVMNIANLVLLGKGEGA